MTNLKNVFTKSRDSEHKNIDHMVHKNLTEIKF